MIKSSHPEKAVSRLSKESVRNTEDFLSESLLLLSDRDPRIEKTKRKLISALMDLSRKEKVSEISVSELCRRAKVNRTTFYKYYSVPEDIISEAVKVRKDYIVRTIRENTDEPEQGTYLVLVHICKMMLSLYLSSKTSYPSMVMDLDDLKDFYPSLRIPEAFSSPALYYFIAGGTNAAMLSWLQDPKRESAEVFSRRLMKIINILLTSSTDDQGKKTDQAFTASGRQE